MRKDAIHAVFLAFLLGAVSFPREASALFSDDSGRELDFSGKAKKITVSDNGLLFDLDTDQDGTVDDLLAETGMGIGNHDLVTPDPSSVLADGMAIEISRSSSIRIVADGKTLQARTFGRSIPGALLENGILLGRLDKTTPEKNSPIKDGTEIDVTRINVEEVVIPEDIPFKTTTKTDSKMGWREKKTSQEGENGQMEVRYRITYRNGKEISRLALEKTVTKEPVQEIITQGTYVKLGDKHTGFGTWYSFKGGLYAASPWLPIGSFAKVTNVANGKSVMVEINDRGPFGKNRIMDLDKEAFQKIAALGAGVISIKVEEVLN